MTLVYYTRERGGIKTPSSETNITYTTTQRKTTTAAEEEEEEEDVRG